MRNKSKNPDPTVSFVTQRMPLTALAARWQMNPQQLETALRRHGDPSSWNIAVELPAESGARALHAARRLINRASLHE